MKLILIPIAVVTLMSCSLLPGNDIPEKDVPSVVKNSFTKEYPQAVDVEWEKHKNNFEVDFEVGNADYTALYSADGKVIMEKQDIAVDALPVAVANKLKESYADLKVDDVDKLEKDGNTYYQVDLEGGITDKNEIFSEDGAIVENVKYWD